MMAGGPCALHNLHNPLLRHCTIQNCVPSVVIYGTKTRAIKNENLNLKNLLSSFQKHIPIQ